MTLRLKFLLDFTITSHAIVNARIKASKIDMFSLAFHVLVLCLIILKYNIIS